MAAIGFYTATVIAGTIAGLAFAVIWLKIVPMRLHGEFWRGMADCSRRMLTVDETSEFVAVYARLGRLVGSYTLRNLGGVLVSIIPVIALWLGAQSLLFAPWQARADNLVVVPAEAGTVAAAPARGGEEVHRLTVAGADRIVTLVGEAPRAALCWTSLRCALFEVLGFEVTRLAAPPAPRLKAVVVRESTGAWNPTWPYLGALEFVFCIALIVSMTVAMARGMKA